MHSNLRTAVVAAACVGLLGMAGCKGAAPGAAADTAKDEAAIRALETAWSAQTATPGAAKDAVKFASHYAADAVLTEPMTPSIHGAKAIEANFAEAFKDPAFTLSFSPDKVVVAKSGDVAYTMGSFKATFTDPTTKQAASGQGVYVTTYHKGADGAWTVDADFAHADSAPAK